MNAFTENCLQSQGLSGDTQINEIQKSTDDSTDKPSYNVCLWFFYSLHSLNRILTDNIPSNGLLAETEIHALLPQNDSTT